MEIDLNREIAQSSKEFNGRGCNKFKSLSHLTRGVSCRQLFVTNIHNDLEMHSSHPFALA